MPLSAKTIRSQLNLLSPLLKNCSLDTLRWGQNKIGELMEAKHREHVIVREHDFDNFKGAWVIPKDERRDGVILYLHGGGYTCGGIEYALGFGSMLAVESGARIFCCAYRLAPEHKYPSALDDTIEAYKYILSKGYSRKQITLCGESAGGGMCYSLCVRLREEGMEMPCAIIALSPWTDLTSAGESYNENCDKDPSMTVQRLKFFTDNYTDDPHNPLVSPVFANLNGMPPSLIFAAENEIMRDDAKKLHDLLLENGCKSQLILKPDRWHAYLLYGLDEDRGDFNTIGRFLTQEMSAEHKLRWLRLDNAAKIYPAARRENWSNVFRVSATLTEAVDKDILSSALDVTLRRFPSIAVRLRRGVFWYYLQQISSAPPISEEYCFPLTRMSKKQTRKCAFRVIVYKNRIAFEVFHSLTDGTGAMIFLKSLVAEYLQQRYGVHIPAEQGVLGRLEAPSDGELEDSFQKYAGSMSASRSERTAWHLPGTPDLSGFLGQTCFKLPVSDVLKKSREYGVTLTAFLCSALMEAIQNMQKEKVPQKKHRMPIKVLIPVNLRKLFPSTSLRNFALYTTPEILPRLGEYEFGEICRSVSHQMGADITPKQMSMKIAANVESERVAALRLTPLFLKNFVMKAVYDAVGERKSCITMSNLGAVTLPKQMLPYVKRMDFVLGVQATCPYNCAVLSFGDTLYINFIRNIHQSELEYHFHRVLQEQGLTASVESNLSSRDISPARVKRNGKDDKARAKQNQEN